MTWLIQRFISFKGLLILRRKSIFNLFALRRHWSHVQVLIWFRKEKTDVCLIKRTHTLGMRDLVFVSFYVRIRRINNFCFLIWLLLHFLNTIKWRVYFVALNRILLWLNCVRNSWLRIFTFLPCLWNDRNIFMFPLLIMLFAIINLLLCNTYCFIRFICICLHELTEFLNNFLRWFVFNLYFLKSVN